MIGMLSIIVTNVKKRVQGISSISPKFVAAFGINKRGHKRRSLGNFLCPGGSPTTEDIISGLGCL